MTCVLLGVKGLIEVFLMLFQNQFPAVAPDFLVIKILWHSTFIME